MKRLGSSSEHVLCLLMVIRLCRDKTVAGGPLICPADCMMEDWETRVESNINIAIMGEIQDKTR